MPGDLPQQTRQARWVSPDLLPDLNIHPSMRLRIDYALKQEPQPYLGMGLSRRS